MAARETAAEKAARIARETLLASLGVTEPETVVSTTGTKSYEHVNADYAALIGGDLLSFEPELSVVADPNSARVSPRQRPDDYAHCIAAALGLSEAESVWVRPARGRDEDPLHRLHVAEVEPKRHRNGDAS
jgi:hypothetical protein